MMKLHYQGQLNFVKVAKEPLLLSMLEKPLTEPTIRKALAIGADDAVRINAAPRDAYFTAYQIAEYAKTGNDLI
jgi:electron transfer flavoprotein alpha/beta subunit